MPNKQKRGVKELRKQFRKLQGAMVGREAYLLPWKLGIAFRDGSL